MNRRRPKPCPAALPPRLICAWLFLTLGLAEPSTVIAEDLQAISRESGRPGGRLVTALRAEPQTFNPVLASDQPSLTIIRRLHADLIQVDRQTQGTIGALAKSWTRSPDGRRYDLELRRGIRFSDGHPFDATDVSFSFRVYLDPQVASPYRDQLWIGGQPIQVRELSPHHLSFELAQPDAWGERLFNDLAILPAHRLEQSFLEGRLSQAWGLQEAPEEIVGLGPFRLKRYLPGERLELERNPYFWKTDRDGQRLPYLDQLIFIFVSSEDTQALRFQASETHLVDRLNASNFALLKRQEKTKAYNLKDLGPGLAYEFLFFNLNDLEERGLPKIARKQRWFALQAFRQAVSAAIDRDSIVRLVYRGLATPVATHVSPGNKLWANAAIPKPRRSLDAARRHLRTAGFRWNEAGRLLDPQGEVVDFSIAASASNGDRLRMATIIQDDLESLGLSVQVVPLEFRSLIDRVLRTFDYEACLLGLGGGDGDPNAGLAVWLSSGEHHFWRPRQEQPATAWEAELDRLMLHQRIALDPFHRRQLNNQIQELVAEHLPFIFLISPNVLVGAHRELGNFAPAVLEHSTLWNAEELFWRQSVGRH